MNGTICKPGREYLQRTRASRAGRYFVVPETFYRPGLGEYRTYGIRFCCSGQKRMLHDISVDLKSVRRIVGIINRLNVSPVHLVEIVGDLMP